MCDCMWLGLSQDTCISIFIGLTVSALIFVAVIYLLKHNPFGDE